MNPSWIVLLPSVMVVCGLIPRFTRALPLAGALLMGAQVPLVALVCLPVFRGTASPAGGECRHDGTGAVLILLTTVAMAAAMFQASFLLPAGRAQAPGEMSDRRFGLFYSLSGLFLIAMYAMLSAQNLGYLWIALEATTLISAPMVYFHRHRSSLEAAWKYLLLCRVGIAFALFGTVLIFASSQQASDLHGTLLVRELISRGASLNTGLLRWGFIFCLLGYGTKAGLFPLHSWLPDAHSEAPAPTSALLSGALLNCALVALWRISRIMAAAGQSALVADTLVSAGAITVLAAGLMLIRQHDLKRMWAYHSVEHMGLLSITIGLGSGSVFLLHAINHTLVKVALFLLAGNILHLYGTKNLNRIKGLLSSTPSWGMLLAAAGFAIVGTPPFGMFISEWMILRDTLAAGRLWELLFTMAGLAITFLALSSHLCGIIFGKLARPFPSQPASWSLAPLLLLLFSLAGGIAITPSCMNLLSFLARGTP